MICHVQAKCFIHLTLCDAIALAVFSEIIKLVIVYLYQSSCYFSTLYSQIHSVDVFSVDKRQRTWSLFKLIWYIFQPNAYVVISA
jgi:hypothetical protein